MSFGGTIDRTEPWGRRRLAYDINNQREGNYVLEVISGPGAMTAELDRRLRVLDVVMRHLIVRVDEDLAVADRAKTRRKSATVARRVRRGLPPEPAEAGLHRPRISGTCATHQRALQTAIKRARQLALVPYVTD